jgi:hypothetical protein
MTRILSTLAGVTRFHSGVGDGDDLLTQVRENPNGEWLASIRKGYGYLGTEEFYLYAVRGSCTFAVTTTGTVQTLVITGMVEDPTKLGPIRMTREGNPRPLPRVASPLRAFRPLTLSGTDLRTGTVPGLLVSLVTQPVTGILLSVPTTGTIAASDEFVYEPGTGKVFLRSAPAFLWSTYLVDETDPDLLRQEEIAVVDRDGKVRAQYSPVFYHTQTSGAALLRPIVRKVDAAGSITTSGIAVSQNTITLPATGGIVSGDVVAVQYYVQDSFTAVPSGTSLVIRYLVAATGTYTVEWETACRSAYDTSVLPSGHVNRLQLNPILTPRETGFLYLVDPSEPWVSPARLRLEVSNANPLYSPSGCATVKVAATVYDAEGEPIPEQPLSVTAAGASGALSLAYGTLPFTDGRGQLLLNWTMLGSGLVTITAVVTGTAVSGTFLFRVRDLRAYTSADEWDRGKLMLHLEEAPWRVVGDRALHRLNAYYCYPDGAPFQPPDSTDSWSTSITFSSNRSNFYNLDGQRVDRPVAVAMDGDSVATILVDPLPGDVLRAQVQTPTTGRIRTARPVRIPEPLEKEG